MIFQFGSFCVRPTENSPDALDGLTGPVFVPFNAIFGFFLSTPTLLSNKRMFVLF